MAFIQIISDIHLEVKGPTVTCDKLLKLPPLLQKESYSLAILGDLSSIDGGINEQRLRLFLRQCTMYWNKVYYVLGNHEFYGSVYETVLKKFRDLERDIPGVIPMEKRVVDLNDHTRLLGATLWSYVPSRHALEVQDQVCDYNYIRVSSSSMTRHLTVCDTNTWHRETISWLDEQLRICQDSGKRAIVLSHHSPMPPGTWTNICSAWSTDLTGMMTRYSKVIRHWGHGHTHRNLYVEPEFPIICNQIGYEEGTPLRAYESAKYITV